MAGFDLRAELALEMPDLERFAGLAARWLDAGSATLAPEFRRQLDPTTPPPFRTGVPRIPGARDGFVLSSNPPPGGMKMYVRPFSGRNLAWQLARLRKYDPPPQDSNLGLYRNDERGFPGPFALRMEVGRADSVLITGRDGPEGRWMLMSFTAPEADLTAGGLDDRWLGFLREIAEEVNPAFGVIDYLYGSGPDPAVIRTIGPPWRLSNVSVPESRRVLRGYGWLTVLAQEMAERLGGVGALKESGAFHEVSQLGQGGVWLLATARYSDFDEAALRRVFNAVRELLPPGMPSQRATHGPPYRIVYEDAASDGRPGHRPG